MSFDPSTRLALIHRWALPLQVGQSNEGDPLGIEDSSYRYHRVGWAHDPVIGDVGRASGIRTVCSLQQGGGRSRYLDISSRRT